MWLSVVIYRQLISQPALINQLLQLYYHPHLSQLKTFAVVLLLMMANWSIEAVKWQLLLKPIEKISFVRSLRSVFTGISISLITPNRIGEYAGRILYLPNVSKAQGVVANVVGSYVQLLVACLLGIIASIYYYVALVQLWFLPYLILLSTVLLIVMLLATTKREYFINFLMQFTMLQKAAKVISIIKVFDRTILWQIAILSLIRYFIFAFQFYLLLLALGVSLPLGSALFTILLIFWAMAVLPTIALAEVPIRTEMSYFFLKILSTNSVAIMSTSLLLWLINLILPALIGLLAIIGLRFIQVTHNK
jgi:uncharacterized membrane protein YbhN (UPF0104 family)